MIALYAATIIGGLAASAGIAIALASPIRRLVRWVTTGQFIPRAK